MILSEHSISTCFQKGTAMNRINNPRPATRPRLTSRGRWLYKLRMSKNWRQSDLAAQLGIHPGRVSEWEQGKREIPEDVLQDLYEIFGSHLSIQA